jgi:hypothetical protein
MEGRIIFAGLAAFALGLALIVGHEVLRALGFTVSLFLALGSIAPDD